MTLTARQIFELVREVGFPVDVFVSPGVSVAEAMVAIALRESAGETTAFNGDAATGDRSYGLWQINCRELGARALTLFAIRSEHDLFDPRENAHAAFVLWGGHSRNLTVAWYINRPGDLTPSEQVYQARYEAHLPAAAVAAAESAA